MSETNGYTNGNGNGNGKSAAVVGSAVTSWFGSFIPPLLASLVSFVFLWNTLAGSIYKEIGTVKEEINKNMDRIEKSFEERARVGQGNRDDITRLQESDIENEVQHAYRGVMTNMEAVIDEMRDWYRSQCPNCKSYERRYFAPQRLGKSIDQ